ncbi:MAG: PaaI family thioesterase [Pseudomonadota bacterium]
MTQTVPDGFTPHFRKSAVTDPWEPLYSKLEERAVIIGLHIGAAHCNSRGLVHGGVIAALADNAMGLSCGRAIAADGRQISGLVTVSLSLDYLGAAKLGGWLTFEPDVIKAGGSLAFVRALIKSDGTEIARASATFKLPSR